MGFAGRGALLHGFADLIEAHADELAMADTTDMGKPISDSRGKDVPRAALNYRFFADRARLAAGEALPMDSGHHAYSRFEPAGVVAAVAPWNFPLMLESWKVAPALAWGNTVVLKPAEDTPASATLMAPAGAGGRAAARRAERAARLRAGLGRRRADRAPGGGPDHVHRGVGHRPGDRPGGRGQPGAG
jgi:acyl-CoA reductase-like NAD-dependent aldehyde dehydrogenase